MRRLPSLYGLAAAVMLPLAGSPVHGQVVLDSFTLGNLADDVIVDLDAGNTFQITEDLGRLEGTNLFHSFRTFSVAAGQTALFTGDTEITNVISRVTGGEASLIDGTLSSSIGSANFWIVNPAGMIFGADAVIDVGGTFNAGAADFIVFPGDVHYSAFDGSVTLTVESPEEFGFLATGGGAGLLQLGPDPASAPNDPGVSFEPGTDRYSGLSFAARTLTLTNGLIGSQAGTDAQGDIALSADDLSIRNASIYINTDTTDAAGNVDVDGGTIRIVNGELSSTTSGAGAAGQILVDGTRVFFDVVLVSSESETPTSGLPGIIDIHGTERVDIRESVLTTETYSDVVELAEDLPGEITLRTDGALEVVDSFLTADALGDGVAGQIDLDGATVLVSGSVLTSGSTPAEGAAGTGVAGIVEIEGRTRLELRDSLIRTSTYSNARIDYGDETVTLDDVPGSIELVTDGELVAVETDLTAATFGASDAGFIELYGRSIRLEGTDIASTSEVANGGWAGDILISGAEAIVISGVASDTGVIISSLRTDTSSQRFNSEGSITLTSVGGQISIADADFTATTSGASNAGFIKLIGSAMQIEDSVIASKSTTEGSGAAGVITIASTQSLTVLRSTISTNTSSSAPVIVIQQNEQGEPEETELVGAIEITVSDGDLLISDSDITSDASGASNAGYIDIDVGGDATIIGGEGDRARITTRSEASLGGDITLTVGGDLDVVAGFIEASAGGLENGGNVEVEALAVFIRESGYFARADQGNGGAITLLVTGANQLFIIDSESEINADSGSGINGDVDINAPDADLAASLQQQDANIVVAPELAADACSPAATGELSTFVQEDEGGTPASPDRYLHASITATAGERAAGAARRAADGPLVAAVTHPREACR